MGNSVTIIDYGMGNLHSIAKALQHVGARVEVTARPERIRVAGHVVFPGVGAIRDCMDELHRLELIEIIREVATARPFLGICLGMQALLEFSEENAGTDCLGLIPGRVRSFAGRAETESLKIPHMGWNTVQQTRRHALWSGIPTQSRFYFVHSYYADPAQESVVGTTPYGIEFTSVIARDNLFAAQFHPEKSQHHGLRLLENFIRWAP
jgi:glutamine amidotransferase